jgi:nucleotide-binding universal stress UspA family protein
VVGAIVINISSTSTDSSFQLSRLSRTWMMISAFILFFVEVSIAIQKPLATVYASLVLVIGLSARAIAHRRRAVAIAVQPTGVSEVAPAKRRRVRKASKFKYVVAVQERSERLLKFAIDEAKARDAMLIVVRIKEISVGALPQTLELRSNGVERRMEEQCADAGINYQIISIPSNEVGYTIVEQAALFGADRVILGATHRSMLEKALRGNVVRSVSTLLPEEIQLIIYGG